MLFVLSGCALDPTTNLYLSRPNSIIGSPKAPDFSLTSNTGKQIELTSERGKVVILSFSAPWCFMCQAEAPRLEFLQDQIGRDRLAIIVVATFDRPDRLEQFAQRSKNLPVAIDLNGEVARAYNVSSLPATFIVGPEGEFVTLTADSSYRFDGMIDWGSGDKVAAIKKLVASLTS